MISIEYIDFEPHSELIENQALVLAQRLQLKVKKGANPCLYINELGIHLKMNQFSLLQAHFERNYWNKRKQEGKKQGLIQACKPQLNLKILDATAGWGRDAAILASFGAEVLMLERNPVMATLIEDGLQRAATNNAALPLSLISVDALNYLESLQSSNYPHIIYIDPMHPQRIKSALVKKELQVLQQLIGADVDAADLIHLACQRTADRVVVKWPQKSKSLLPAALSIPGKTVRFDIYFKK